MANLQDTLLQLFNTPGQRALSWSQLVEAVNQPSTDWWQFVPEPLQSLWPDLPEECKVSVYNTTLGVSDTLSWLED
jgi:hypothetical protein